MKIYESYNRNKKIPQIRISNQRIVKEAGFEIGDYYRITYSKNQIILTKGGSVELLTDEILEQFKQQGCTSGMDTDKIKIVVKYFLPETNFTFYAVEYNTEEEIIFGFVSLMDEFNDELGYISLSELKSLRSPKLKLPVEYDLYFEEHLLSEVLNGQRP